MYLISENGGTMIAVYSPYEVFEIIGEICHENERKVGCTQKIGYK